ncbi:hypothetical protein B0H34DRAFT_779746 [Crassisporium funariophilum]|nr:hypothetical protein B0H34DRAFT_779746 [Crassisporium funariophilum]
MATQKNLPFGMASVLPELQNVIPPRRKESVDAAPSFFRLSPDARTTMNLHISQIGIDHHRLNYSAREQEHGMELFSTLQLYIPHQNNEDERDVQDSKPLKARSAKEKGRYKRYTQTFHCQCGMDHTTGRFAGKKCQIPWKDVGCLCWIKLVTVHDENHGINNHMIAIDEISGILDHSEHCKEQIEMEQNLRVPLSPELQNYALELLQENTPLCLLRSKCTIWAEQRWPGIPGDLHYRYRLTPHDASSLYCTISRERGIPQRLAAEDNLDKWFRTEKPQPPSPLLIQSCFHYQPHKKGVSDRFKIILATPEMQEAAWKYGHKKQVLMDLTFGVCSARTLLVILMALNKTGTGIPICFMMATHSDYNGRLLTRLLNLYKAKMGRNDLGKEFDISVGNTDNDSWERKALLANWKGIFLLLCMFHVWQAWRNGLNKSLRPVPKGDGRQTVRTRIGKFLMKLLKDITEGKKRSKATKCQSKAALDFLAYLRSYVKQRVYWMSWSPAGAIEAANWLGVPVSQIARTTNALESFNGRIKGAYYKPYQHSGRLPQINVWILLLVTKELKSKAEMKNYLTSLRLIKPQTKLDIPSFPFPATSDVTIDTSLSHQLDSTYHDDLIKQWLIDLENDSFNFDNTSEPDSDAPIDEQHADSSSINEEDSEAAHHHHINNEDPDVMEDHCISSRYSDHDYDQPMEAHKQHDSLNHRPRQRSASESFVDNSVGSFDGILGINWPWEANQDCKTIICLPTSPQPSKKFVTDAGTSMMRLQAAEDVIIREIQNLMELSHDFLPQLEKYMSESVHERLNSWDSRVNPKSDSKSSSEHPNLDNENDRCGGPNKKGDGLVPSKQQRKEVRKE